jgi:UDP-N-acetylglucosamine:LPS N-acetylglucosamine transferase
LKKRKILAIASGGGHWVQLLRLRPAFAGNQTVYVTTQRGYQHQVAGERFYAVRDASRWNKLALLLMMIQVSLIVLWERPAVVITTGAAPGVVALRMGKLLGARTIWLDSIANAEQVSMSGQWAGKFADVWLTQWEHLASEQGPAYKGAVL